ncbi:WD40 repeat-like protein [Suillus weaverae]|nr:WD40 repeat-like protein [Suillus weaverae]
MKTQVMASASKHRSAAATSRILTPVMTLKGHKDSIPSIYYFPDGEKMISGSWDNTVRRWDLQSGKEIEEVRDIGKHAVRAVVVSRDGRWVISAGGDANSRRVEIKACEVETGFVKRFQTNTEIIICIDISADGMLLASGSMDDTVQIWNFHTCKLVAGPFESADLVGTVRFSHDSKKLAVNSPVGTSLEVWDVETKTLDVRIGKSRGWDWTYMPILLWTDESKTIIAAFTFTNDDAKTIYEFDGLTLKTVGTPFEGHTEVVRCLALSSDGALLASAADDHTIKLWAFGTRQLLASFDVQHPQFFVLSPDARQLAYTKFTDDDRDLKIYICENPPDVLATIGLSPKAQSTPAQKTNTALKHLLQVRIASSIPTPLIYMDRCSLMQPAVLLQHVVTQRCHLPHLLSLGDKDVRPL